MLRLSRFVPRLAVVALVAAATVAAAPTVASASMHAQGGVFPFLAFDRITCAGCPSSIYVLGVRPHSVQTVEVRLGAGRNPAWSPDGRRIAFDDNRNGNEEIFVMNANRHHVVQLTHNGADDAEPTWSPDGQHIAFTRFFNEPARIGGDIVVMNANGGNEVNITNTSPTSEEHPSWSRTNRIAFTRSQDIWTMNPDGSAKARLTTTGNSGIASNGPDWSPDGRQIAFFSQVSGDGIYIMRADGTDVHLISPVDPVDRDPSWGLFGLGIAFSSFSNTAPANENIFAMTPDGQHRVQLTHIATSGHPDWRF